MLEAGGSTVEEIEAATGLGRNQILGISGALKKAAKKLSKVGEEPSKDLGKADQEEETTLVKDLRDEAKLTGAAVTLARNQNRLKAVAPGLYDALHGSGQSEASSGKILADLELAKYIKQMRENESHPNNGDSSSQATTELQRQINELKEELHKKDIEALTKQNGKLEEEIRELRAGVRGSAGAQSDLAIVVKESKDLLSQIITHDGPLRSYLMPDNISIKAPGDAPLLRAQPVEARSGVVDVLRERGLTTRVVQR
jgi:hypothetical protein